MSERYLTPKEKSSTLAAWEQAKRRPRPDRSDVGGRGFPDPVIFEWVDRLNNIPGVCTVQSCAGHAPEHSEGGGWYRGNLWLRLDEAMARHFEHIAPSLATDSHVERIGKHWQSDGREIAEITFHGAECGKLDESMSVILAAIYAPASSPRGTP